MDRIRLLPVGRVLGLLLVAAVTVPAAGCIGPMALFMQAMGKDRVPAACGALVERRVAVVCCSESGVFESDLASSMLATRINMLLADNVKKIQVIEQQTINDWRDENDWDGMDYVPLGEGVGADLIVAIDLGSLSLHEGQTMYRGQAEATVSVYDVANRGKKVFRHTPSPSQLTYPVQSGVDVHDISEADFRREYVDILARWLARCFYPYEFQEDFAVDRPL